MAVAVARQHGLPAARLYRWKKQLEHGADEYLKSGRPRKDAQLRELVVQGILAQGLDRAAQKPRLRTDQGSPNLAGSVKEFFAEIGMELSPGRVRRPTDNARVERCNGTLKQEEIYCQGSSGYLSPEGARLSLGRYIDYYCHERPHQAWGNFTPA